MCFYCFFNDTATTEIYTLSLHDALPIYAKFTCLNICVWSVCDYVWGNNSSSLCYTHLWAYTIHPLLLYVGTTPLVKGTAQLYFGL